MAGGFSGEAAISGNSGRMVMKNIDREIYNPRLFWITSDEWYAELDGKHFPIDKNDFSTEVNGERFCPDFAFIMIHGTPGEDGILQGYLELLGIPYSTGNALNMALTFHKGMTVSALRGMDIPVAKGVLLHSREGKTNEEILAITGLPCFVKPNQGGSSIGMSKVKVAEALDEAIEIAFKEDKDVLIETFMEGTEVQCGVTPWKGGLKALPLTEIVSHNEFFDYAAKYEGQSDEITPARISQALTEHVQNTAKMVYQATNCRGMIRIDFMIVEDVAHIIEINTVPGFSEASIIPQQAAAANISATELISSVIEATC